MEKDNSSSGELPIKSEKDKKKSANALGVFAIDFEPKTPKSAAKKTERAAEDAWTMPTFEPAPKAETAHVPDMPEAESALETAETLTEGERDYATAALVRAKRMHEAEPDDADQPFAELQGPQTERGEAAANEAIAHFHERILENPDTEAALADTLAEIEALPEQLEPTEAHDSDQLEPLLSETNESEALANESQQPESEPPQETIAEDEPTEPMAQPTAPPTTPPRRPTPPPVNRRPSSVLGATATPVGAGFYNLNPLAAGPGAGAALKREHMNVVDESFLAPISGAIVGYLIGRRHGKNKAKKELLPVQKKLEKQVANLQADLAAKEQTIRSAVRAKQRHEPLPKPEQVAPKTVEAAVEKRVVAPEARSLHVKAPAGEQLGQIVMGAEALAVGAAVATAINSERPRAESAAPNQVERIKQTTEKPEAPSKNIETLSRSELMNLSDKIIIEGTSLRQIYETNLVGERGLRRLVSEHLRGGDLQKALRQEIVEREIDFERDPVMRDLPGSAEQASRSHERASQPRNTSLDGLLEKAGAAIPGNEDEVSFLKARAAYQEKEQAKKAKQQQVIEVSLAGTIVLLLTFIVILALTR